MRAFILLLLGAAAILVATVAGRSDLIGSVLEPPFAARVMLGVAAAIVGVLLLVRAAERMGNSREPADLIRAVRVAFLAVGAFSAAAGWLFGSPVPIVAALIIIGVDVLETSFLLLVTATRDPAGQPTNDDDPGAHP